MKRHTGFLPYQLLFCMIARVSLKAVLWKKKMRGKNKRRTRCQFHLVLCAVNCTISHNVYAEGFIVLTYRSRTVGHCATCISHLPVARCVDLSRWKWNDGRFDVAAIYFHVDSTRTFHADLRPNGRSFLLVSAAFSQHTEPEDWWRLAPSLHRPRKKKNPSFKWNW